MGGAAATIQPTLANDAFDETERSHQKWGSAPLAIATSPLTPSTASTTQTNDVNTPPTSSFDEGEHLSSPPQRNGAGYADAHSQ
jgi:hypothetical protein